MSTTIVPSPTVVSAKITVTVTASPAPELFLETFWGGLAMLNVLIMLLGVWTALIVGFNRLSIIPPICSAAAAVGNGLLFIELRDIARGGVVWRPAGYIFMFAGWTTQHFYAAMYAYFMLNHLLQKSRKL